MSIHERLIPLEFPKEVKAVLFDWDGVIAKVDKVILAWQKAFSDYQVLMEPHDWYVLEGKSPIEIANEIGTNHGLTDIQCIDIEHRKTEYYRELHKDGVELYPDVESTLSELRKRGLKMAVVTGAKRQRLEESAEKYLALFDVVVCVDDPDVLLHKPHPHPWLAALKRLGMTAEYAVGIENAILGLQSLQAAKVYSIGVTSTLASPDLLGANHIVTNLSDILAFIY